MSREDGSLTNNRSNGCDKCYYTGTVNIAGWGGLREGFLEEVTLVLFSEE